ncbi:hypothetical protein KIH74_00245 [Kineosporia sp. J2-2]|uniref:Immunity protein 51 of polymorphic toxin system n=1 Tax=Kineosporia corallincola TaxID=2835133 RepID=A0ABS5T8D9_9ACTN|nr:Imm51 family immunity protein [Kineosporia corallincola]MBT0767331.1 hypothetical protein [Kineosporia corallincola]
MQPLKLVETTPGHYSLLLTAGDTPSDTAVDEAGHEPNGYFWEGMAEWLIRTRVPELDGRLKFDPEGGMFCAYGTDREALAALGSVMAEVVNAPERIGALIATAEEAGVVFDD